MLKFQINFETKINNSYVKRKKKISERIFREKL